MNALRFRRLTITSLVLWVAAGCAREHRGIDRNTTEDAGATLDAAALPDGMMGRFEPSEVGPFDRAGAPPRIELIDDASWPAGLWVGQSVFANACATESRRVSVRFESDAEGNAPRGRVVFGEHEKVVPVDPARGYPDPNLRRSDYRCMRDELYDGYPYSIRVATVWPDGRMTVWLSPDEMYDEWCSLQTSYPSSPQPAPAASDWYECIALPVSQYQLCDGDHKSCPVDYGKWRMCSENYCHCAENGCRAPFSLSVRMDLAVADQRMEGVILTQNASAGTAIKLRWVE